MYKDTQKKALYYVLLFSGVIFGVAIMLLIPGISISFFSLLLLTLVIPTVVVALNVSNQINFNILNFYSLIFLLESFGGALAAAFPTPLPGHKPIPEALLFKTVAVYLLGYLLFLLGYYSCNRWFANRQKGIRRNTKVYPNRIFALSRRQWHKLFMVLPIFISLGLVKVIQKIEAAGGFTAYLSSMYLYRFGNYTQDVAENAWVSLAGQLDNLAFPLAALGLTVCITGRAPKLFRNFLFLLLAVILFQKFSSGFRSVIFFALLSLIMVYDNVRPIKLSKLFFLAAVLIVFLMLVNNVHQHLYFLTAGWARQTFQESLARLVAPQGHLATLASILNTLSYRHPLYGEGLLESVFFFVPRLVWHSKAEQYGTIIVQQWAGIPDWYQAAPTNVGELIARFGYLGAPGMLFIGGVHRWLETFRLGSYPMRMGYFCIILPRILVHLGMGISALSITIFGMALLYFVARVLRLDKVTTSAAATIFHASRSRNYASEAWVGFSRGN